MERTDKQNDAVLMLRISRAYNLRNVDDAKKVYAYVQEKNPFKSQLGEIFRNRLRLLAKGEITEFPCLFCRKGNAPDGIICPECMGKLTGKADRSEQKKQAEPVSTGKPSPAPISRPGAATAKEPAQTAIARAGETPKKKISRKSKIILATVLTMAAIMLIGAWEDSKGSASSAYTSSLNIAGTNMSATNTAGSGRVVVSDRKSATEILEEIFPPSDYDIICVQSDRIVSTNMFTGDTVKYWDIDDDLEHTETIMAYFFYVDMCEYNAPDHPYAWCLVSEAGQVIGYGTLISSEDPDAVYRLK